MKKDIHPENFEVTLKCACGNSFQALSTSKDVHVDICSACHPFFTGQQKFIDTAGRIDKFEQRYAKNKKTAKKKSK